MTLESLTKRLADIMRADTGIDGTAQRLAQIVWLLFLKAFDYEEENAELENNYQPIIPVGYRWRDWVTCANNPKKKLTGPALIRFVNDQLIPVLRGETIQDNNGRDVVPFQSDSPQALLVKDFMRRVINYSQNGVQFRLMLDELDKVDFEDIDETRQFNGMYESLLASLQSAGNAGEFYTPRAVTGFTVKHVNPQLGEKIADFACGTCGFLVDALRVLESQVPPGQVQDLQLLQNSLIGEELKPLPYMLGVTNLMLHGIKIPNITYGDSLAKPLNSYTSADQVDVITMNPPYGGVATEADLSSFPQDVRSKETSDLFVSLIIKRLKNGGRAAVVLPDGFLFGSGPTTTIKKQLMSQCNLHTIIRLPESVFAPYTSINTNILFFNKGTSTQETWFYRMDMPSDRKHFSKTKPILPEHFEKVDKWWNDRKALKDNQGFDKARCFTIDEIKQRNYDLDLCKYPEQNIKILSPSETIKKYQQQRNKLNKEIDETLTEIMHDLGIENK